MKTKLLSVLVPCLMTGVAFAQTGEPEAQPPARSPLAGPKVPSREGKTSLVERGADGKVKRLEEWPALAALRKLKLDDATRKAVQKLETEQAAAMDKFLSENLLEIAAVANAFQSGDTQEGLAGIKKLQADHPALDDRTRLSQKLGKILTKEQDAEMRAMIQEYWNALVQEESESAKTRGEKASAGKIAGAESLRLLGSDIKASYERVIGQQVKDFDDFIKKLGLNPEQEGKVRRVVDDAFAKSKGDKKKVNKSEVFWKIWKELDAKQRNTLVELFRHPEK